MKQETIGDLIWNIDGTVTFQPNDSGKYTVYSPPKSEPDIRDSITAFILGESGTVWRIKSDGEFRAANNSMVGFDVDYFLEDNGYKIYSVKNDKGVEFVLGDAVSYSEIENFNILNFRAEKDIIYAYGHLESGFNINLLTKSEKKTPLFKTEDGVSIFSGDHYYSVSDDFKVLRTDCASTNRTDYGTLRSFSTREVANNYVLMNRPLFSVSDIVKNSFRLNSSSDGSRYISEKGFFTLANEKMKDRW